MSTLRAALPNPSSASGQISGDACSNAMPRWLWALPAAIALLRCLPWLATYWLDPPAGSSFVHVGYLPKDVLQYLAFARQAAEGGGPFAANPFTTEPQDGRFLLPLFTLLGALSGWIGGSLIVWVELARIPLLFAYYAVLWRFLALFVPAPRERALVCVCIGLSGGLEVFAKLCSGWIQSPAGQALQLATGQEIGWSTFAAAWNPLWTAGGIGFLALLRPLLRPETTLTPSRLLASAAGLFALFVVHPYSAITAATVLVFAIVAGWLFRERTVAGRTLSALAAAAVAIALLGAWQRADPVFAVSAARAVGPQQLSPFWYPLVYGGLCVFALRGAREWVSSAHPLRFTLLAWLLAAVWLHTSTVLSGYHFAIAMHLPLCILAAPSFVKTWDRACARRPAAIGMCALTLLAPLWLTLESILRIPATHEVPIESGAIIEDLRTLAPGNVFTSQQLGNLLPAYTPHHVYMGHHFLTPELKKRNEVMRDLIAGSPSAKDVEQLVRGHALRYAILPLDQGALAIETLRPWTSARRRIGRFAILELGTAPP